MCAKCFGCLQSLLSESLSKFCSSNRSQPHRLSYRWEIDVTLREEGLGQFNSTPAMILLAMSQKANIQQDHKYRFMFNPETIDGDHKVMMGCHMILTGIRKQSRRQEEKHRLNWQRVGGCGCVRDSIKRCEEQLLEEAGHLWSELEECRNDAIRRGKTRRGDK